jgi:hypothetical protein
MEVIGVDGRIMLKRILKKYSVEWDLLVQDRDQCGALVNTAMNIRLP